MPKVIYRTADGVRVPSVTTIIGGNLGWDKEMLLGWTRKMMRKGEDPIAFRDRAGAFGTVVHKFVEEGTTDVQLTGDEFKAAQLLTPKMWDDAKAAFGRYVVWAEAHNIQPLHSELSLVSEEHKYGGTLDKVALVDDRPCLLDVKTSSTVRVSHRIQVAAYKQLYIETHGVELHPILLHLPGRQGEDEPLEPVPMGPLGAEWEAFLHLRALHELKKTLSPFERGDT